MCKRVREQACNHSTTCYVTYGAPVLALVALDARQSPQHSITNRYTHPAIPTPLEWYRIDGPAIYLVAMAVHGAMPMA